MVSTQDADVSDTSTRITDDSTLTITSEIKSWVSYIPTLAAIRTVVQNTRLTFEKPKKASEHNRWSALAGCGVHLLPLAITSVLICLNIFTVYWESFGASDLNLRLNALQFAAKIHEVLIATSLSTVNINFVQYQVIRGSGIPLGGLLVGFELTDLRILWRPGLWAVAFTKAYGIRRLLFILLVGSLALLVGVIGPASAILMLPSVDWWDTGDVPIQLWYSGFTERRRLYFTASEPVIWPQVIDSMTGMPSTCENSSILEMSYFCPGEGLAAIVEEDNLKTIGTDGWNLTMKTTTEEGVFTRFIEGSIHNAPFHGDTISTYEESGEVYANLTTVGYNYNISHFISQSTGVLESKALKAISSIAETGATSERYALRIGDGRSPSVPLAYLTCFPNLQSGDFIFPLKPYANSSTWSSEARVMQMNGSLVAGIWIQPPDLGSDTPSINVAFSDETTFATCSIYAGWQAAGVYLDKGRDAYIHSYLKPPSYQLNEWEGAEKRPVHFKPVFINVDWANQVFPLDQILSEHLPLMRNISADALKNIFPAVLSSLMTDAISRTAADTRLIALERQEQYASRWVRSYIGDGPNYRFFQNDQVNLSKFTEVKLTRYRYGFGYSLRGATRLVALGILLVHVFIALAHTTSVVLYGWKCHALKSVYEILALAVNSVPTTVLENTCAGIDEVQTFKHIVKVREVSDTHLGLVFDKDEDDEDEFPLAQDEKLYGSLGCSEQKKRKWGAYKP